MHDIFMYVNEFVTMSAAVPVTFTGVLGTCITLEAEDETHTTIHAHEGGAACVVVKGTVEDEEIVDLFWVYVESRHAEKLKVKLSRSKATPGVDDDDEEQDSEGAGAEATPKKPSLPKPHR